MEERGGGAKANGEADVGGELGGGAVAYDWVGYWKECQYCRRGRSWL